MAEGTVARGARCLLLAHLFLLGCGSSPGVMPSNDAAGDPSAGPDLPAETADATDGGAMDETSLPPPVSPSPWLAEDIGTPDIKGNLTSVSTGFTIRGGGSGIGGAADAFFFAYQKLTGDGEIVARVKSLLKVSLAGQVGIMIRGDVTAPGAPFVYLSLPGDSTKGGQLLSRLSANAAADVQPQTGLGQGQLLRLVRTSKVVTAFGGDGRGGWTQLGIIEIDLPAEIALGLAASDGAAATAASAELDQASIQNLAGDPTTKEWVLSELGTMGSSAIVSNGTVTVSGLGEKSSTTSDVGVLVQRAASGILTITAKVDSFVATVADARVGLMIREGTPEAPLPDPAFALMSVTTRQGAQFQNRSMAGGPWQAGAGMAGVVAPVWLRLEKLDDISRKTSTFRGFLSADGMRWDILDSLTYPLAEPYSIGFYLLAGSSTGFATARFSQISVTTPK